MPTFPNGMTVNKGQVGRLTHRYTGQVDEPNASFSVTVEVNWVVGRDVMYPEHVTTDDYYIITIEGRPAEPGWIDMIHPAQHWRTDLREYAPLT